VAKAAVPGDRPPGYTRDPSRPVIIIIDNFPPYANPDDIAMSIGKRGQEYAWHARHPGLGALTGQPIKDIADLTTRGEYWFACLPADGTPRRCCATSS
jgi:hypothetical protein